MLTFFAVISCQTIDQSPKELNNETDTINLKNLISLVKTSLNKNIPIKFTNKYTTDSGQVFENDSLILSIWKDGNHLKEINLIQNQEQILLCDSCVNGIPNPDLNTVGLMNSGTGWVFNVFSTDSVSWMVVSFNENGQCRMSISKSTISKVLMNIESN